MGIRTALETQALQWEIMSHNDRVKEMMALLKEVDLREYLTVRDKKYKDYRTAEQAILDRSKREGEAWKGVSGETSS